MICVAFTLDVFLEANITRPAPRSTKYLATSRPIPPNPPVMI